MGLVVAGCAPDLKVAGAGGEGGMGTGGGVDETCDDGVDNDGDMLVDCADTVDCGKSFTCQPPAPDGWTYILMRRLPYGSAAITCPDGSEPQKFFEDPGKSMCMPCNCQASGQCSQGISCYLSTGCAGPAGSKSYSTEGVCTAIMPVVSFASCKVDGTATVPSNATCTASGGNLSNTNPYGKEVYTCPAVGTAAGCTGQTCVANPPQGFDDRLCVASIGANVCPAGFTEQHDVYGAYTDDRACSSCSCDAAQITCAGPTTFALWTDAACTQGNQLITSAGGCADLVATPTHITATTLPNQMVPKPACTGGVATGAVTGSEPSTICCMKP